MLIRFSVKNWMCFKDEVTIDMVAGDLEQNHKERLSVLKDGTKLLPITAIYGANGAGKTILFEALKFVIKYITKINDFKHCNNDKNDINYDNDKNSKFEFEFVLSNKIYFLKLTFANGLFQSASIKDSEGNLITTDKLVYKKIIKWFESICFISRSQDCCLFPSKRDLKNDKKILSFIRNNLNDFLWRMGFSYNHKIKADKYRIQQKNEFNYKYSTVIDYKNKQLKMAYNSEEIAYILVENYFDNYEIGWDRESEGLKWIVFYLLPFLYQMYCIANNKAKPSIFIVDNFEGSMHPVLTRKIIESFLDDCCNGNNRTQLIFTTHDTQFIDRNILRTDEIFLLDKKSLTNSSNLYPLYDFQDIHPDDDLKKDYLDKRFGGIPNVLSSLF